MMVDFAARMTEAGHAIACSPDPSVRPRQALVLVHYASGTLGTATIDPTGADPIGLNGGLCNYDHHGDDHRARMLDALEGEVRGHIAADLAELLGDYKEFWRGHHLTAAALTMWWDARMTEGHTVEHAQFLLSLIAHPDVLSRVMFVEHDGRTRAWLDHYPAGHPSQNPARSADTETVR